MRLLKALIISTFVSAATLFLTALTFVLLSIYQPGRLINWLNQPFEHGMSPYNYLLIIITIAVFTTLFIRIMNKDKATKDTPPTPESD